MIATPMRSTITTALDQRVADVVAAALRGLVFGTVTITLRDGVVMSVDRLERTRLPATK